MWNKLLLTDSYKLSHFLQFPPNTQNTYYYLESRGGLFKETTFFGLQYLLRNLQGRYFIKADVEEANIIAKKHGLTFNKEGFLKLQEKYNSYLPIVIKAVKEGTTLPISNVLLTVESTDPEFHWLVSYLEPLFVQLWYPITVCTLSREVKKIIKNNMLETSDTLDKLPFMLHDFGFRGVSSIESAGIGGMAHLVNFLGTDTLIGMTYADIYYNAGVCGYSIPAAEHSTITSWGKENEEKAYENMLDVFKEGLVAVVSDSWDIHNACKNIWGKTLKDKVLARNGTVVIRPDSGDPVETVLSCLKNLEEAFGCINNNKGYKLLPPQVRLIQGDGVNINSIEEILKVMKNNKYSADNIAFGMGGALLQKVNRDTQRFAFKCSAIKVNDEWRDVYKSPIGDTGKLSKKGKLVLFKYEEGYKTISYDANKLNGSSEDHLIEVFRDGVIKKEYSFDEIRKCSVV